MLLTRTETYRVESEESAVKMINDAKEASLTEAYSVTKSSYVMRTKKQKGEIVEAWYIVSLTFDYSI